MVGGTIFHRWVIQREISRVLVLNLLWHGKPRGAQAPPRITMLLTLSSLLSRATQGYASFKRAKDAPPAPRSTAAPPVTSTPPPSKPAKGGASSVIIGRKKNKQKGWADRQLFLFFPFALLCAKPNPTGTFTSSRYTI